MRVLLVVSGCSRPPVQLGIGGPIHHSHTTFTDFLKNFVMANGLADHESTPHAMQLASMLRVGGAKGNGKGQS